MWATFCQVILGHPEPKTLVNSLATLVNVAKETLKDSLDVLLPMILGRVTLILVSTLSFQVQPSKHYHLLRDQFLLTPMFKFPCFFTAWKFQYFTLTIFIQKFRDIN